MPGYVMADVRVTDPDVYAGYTARTPGSIASAGGTFVVRGGTWEALAGGWQPSRLVLIRFDTVARARGWYDSPEYTELRAIRQRASEGALALAEGQEGAGSAYVMARADVSDPAGFAGYSKRVAPSIAEHGGAALVQGTPPTVLEGAWPGDAMIVAVFPDRDAAKGWYQADGHQRALAASGATLDAVLVDGA